jgi:hypothetical protein
LNLVRITDWAQSPIILEPSLIPSNFNAKLAKPETVALILPNSFLEAEIIFDASGESENKLYPRRLLTPCLKSLYLSTTAVFVELYKSDALFASDPKNPESS